MSDNEGSSDGYASCGGCLVVFLVVWVFLFGVSFGGAHYDVGCSASQGIEINEDR